ncbi:hypothetical protein [Streptomyces sp. SID3343]|nr:hypothetical protein [Streptomyces sp. SID3343]MYW01029.1 hypothetical protein [Streptomyces sp. SID3343]
MCGGANDNGPYGTVWWVDEDSPGTHTATLARPDTESKVEVVYTVGD